MHANRVADRVYGEVCLPRLGVAVLATPEFQRLAGLKQLGGTFYVYSSATHTRLEHSIGVCHLAGCAARHLQAHYPHLVDADDILCAELAGLVHDLGHGPLSHLFEEHVRAHGMPQWDHETMGLRMLDVILARHDLQLAAHFSTPPAQNVAFIKLLVTGYDPETPWPTATVGRPPTKRFFPELIHAYTTGVDVDKLDYLCRDPLAVFGAVGALKPQRIIAAMRVAMDGSLCFTDNVAHELLEVYQLRAQMHRRVYQHRAVAVAEGLLLELMAAVDAALPPEQRLVAAAADPARFAELTDAAVLHRAYLTDPALADAPRRAYLALHRRPWLARLPLSVSLDTRPRCSECGAATRPLDCFCAACGTSTAARAARAQPLVTQASATAALRQATGRSDARVFVIDITCGAEVRLTDAHGGVWRDFDPLAKLQFVAAGDAGETMRLRPEAFALPSEGRVRIAHAYLAPDAPPTALDAATAAFRAWGETHGVITECN